MRANAAEDRVDAGVGEARGDRGEVERGTEEHLAPRAAGGVEVGPLPGRDGEPDRGQCLPAGAPVLGDEDAAVFDETAVSVALLHPQPELVAGGGGGGEKEAPPSKVGETFW